MIDWLYVGLSALWIAGLSLELAALGIALYLASEEKQQLGKVLSRNGFRLALDLGMLLFCAGLAGLAAAWWEKLLWGLLGVGFIASDGFERRSVQGRSTKSGAKEE
jgi:hypothetical protein